jgi:hypothetical protein
MLRVHCAVPEVRSSVRPHLHRVSATMAKGKRPVPSRTRKLSLSAPMVLRGGLRGRVGRRRTSSRWGPLRWSPSAFSAVLRYETDGPGEQRSVRAPAFERRRGLPRPVGPPRRRHPRQAILGPLGHRTSARLAADRTLRQPRAQPGLTSSTAEYAQPRRRPGLRRPFGCRRPPVQRGCRARVLRRPGLSWAFGCG